MIDMRKRFRGNKPISTSSELEGEGGSGSKEGKEVPMLYAGKGSFEGVGPRKTDGREGVEAAASGGGGGEYEVFVRNDGVEDLRKR
jgi:cytochrome c oxidase assembly factor 5